jgi:hypothetical protein
MKHNIIDKQISTQCIELSIKKVRVVDDVHTKINIPMLLACVYGFSEQELGWV